MVDEQPIFQEVIWSQYCVLFPDGSHSPYNEQVRYTALKGWLRKQKVRRGGHAEYALQYGTKSSGWYRHYVHLDEHRLAWFDGDPETELSKTRMLPSSPLAAPAPAASRRAACDERMISLPLSRFCVLMCPGQ